jgi:hypothetical protein
MLLSPPLLKKLDALSLQARKAFTGSSRGEKRSTRRGSSSSLPIFARITWATTFAASTGTLTGDSRSCISRCFSKRKTSTSRCWWMPAFDAVWQPVQAAGGQQIAAAIGYIGLTNFDRVTAATFDSTVRAWFPPTRGRGAGGTLFNFSKRRVRPAPPTERIHKTHRDAGAAQRHGGCAVRFLAAGRYQTGLKTLRRRASK